MGVLPIEVSLVIVNLGQTDFSSSKSGSAVVHFSVSAEKLAEIFLVVFSPNLSVSRRPSVRPSSVRVRQTVRSSARFVGRGYANVGVAGAWQWAGGSGGRGRFGRRTVFKKC